MNGTKDWAELVREFEAHHTAPRIPTLPVAVACHDPNPWDSELRCTKPSGHTGLHEHLIEDVDFERWNDACHWAGDSCQPCENPRGWAA